MKHADANRRTHFVCGGNHADPIRGRGFFENSRTHHPDLFTVSPKFSLERERCGLYILLMPCHPGIADALEHVATLRCNCRSIVDVHADWWNPSFSPSGDDDAVAWWRQGDRIPTLERCIRTADVVTVPSADYVRSVSGFTPNIVIVPDCPDGALGEAARRGWADAVRIASLPR